MPRAKKNPITEMPVMEVDPIADKPESRPQSNVVPISNASQVVQSERDWSDVDSVLSTVVSFI